MERCRRLGEECCRNQPNITTPQRHNIVTSQHCNVAGKSLGEAIKGTGESQTKVRNSFADLGFEKFELETKEIRLED